MGIGYIPIKDVIMYIDDGIEHALNTHEPYLLYYWSQVTMDNSTQHPAYISSCLHVSYL